MQFPEYENFFIFWKKQIYLFVALAAAFQLVAAQLNPFFISIVVLPICYFFAKLLTRRYLVRPASNKQFVVEIFLVSLFVRIATVFLMAFIFQMCNGSPFMADRDDFVYHQSMLQFYEYWKEYGISPVYNTNITFSRGMYSGYPYFGAFMMEIFGPNVYSARIGNAILSSFTVLLAFGILSNCVERGKALFGTVLFALCPIVDVYAACNLKDSMLLFCFMLEVWGLGNIVVRRRWATSVAAILAGFVVMIFCRPAMIFITLASANIFFLLRLVSLKKSVPALATCFVLLFVILGIWKHCNDIGLTMDYDDFIDSQIAGTSRSVARTSAAGVARLSFAKLLSAPLFVASAPFLPPAQLASYGEKAVTINFSFSGMLVYFTLLPAMIFGAYQAFKIRMANPVPFLLLILCVFYKVAQANSVLSVFSARQSLPAIALLTLLIPVGVDRFYNKRLFVSVVNIIAILVLVAYNVYRVFF